MADLICARCGTRGKPKSVTRGSIFIEIVLWLCFLLPGFIYSLWRLTTRQKACRTCEAAELVPVTTPAGRELLSRFQA